MFRRLSWLFVQNPSLIGISNNVYKGICVSYKLTQLYSTKCHKNIYKTNKYYFGSTKSQKQDNKQQKQDKKQKQKDKNEANQNLWSAVFKFLKTHNLKIGILIPFLGYILKTSIVQDFIQNSHYSPFYYYWQRRLYAFQQLPAPEYYVSQTKVEQTISQILNWKEGKSDVGLIFVSGFPGCGKTTSIRKLINQKRKQQSSSIFNKKGLTFYFDLSVSETKQSRAANQVQQKVFKFLKLVSVLHKRSRQQLSKITFVIDQINQLENNSQLQDVLHGITALYLKGARRVICLSSSSQFISTCKAVYPRFSREVNSWKIQRLGKEEITKVIDSFWVNYIKNSQKLVREIGQSLQSNDNVYDRATNIKVKCQLQYFKSIPEQVKNYLKTKYYAQPRTQFDRMASKSTNNNSNRNQTDDNVIQQQLICKISYKSLIRWNENRKFNIQHNIIQISRQRMDFITNCFCFKKKDPPPKPQRGPKPIDPNQQALQINPNNPNHYLDTQTGEKRQKQIDENILHQVGWIGENSGNDQTKTQQFGNTVYCQQIGNQDLSSSRIKRTKNKQLDNWASVDPNKQRTPMNTVQKWQSATKYLTKKGKDKAVIDTTQINLNINSFRQSVTQMQFSPFIRYRIVPYLDQRMALDVTSTNDPLKKLKKNGLIIWDYHGGPNQLFFIREYQPYSNVYFFLNMAKGFLLTAPDYIGENQQVYANNLIDAQFSKKQLWAIKKVENFYYIESVFHPGYIMDLRHERTRNGTKVIIYKKPEQNIKSNQKWSILSA